MRILRGEVTDVKDGVYVQIPDYGDDVFGPMETLNAVIVVRGDRVVVAQVSRVKEDLIVLGKVS